MLITAVCKKSNDFIDVFFTTSSCKHSRRRNRFKRQVALLKESLLPRQSNVYLQTTEGTTARFANGGKVPPPFDSLVEYCTVCKKGFPRSPPSADRGFTGNWPHAPPSSFARSFRSDPWLFELRPCFLGLRGMGFGTRVSSPSFGPSWESDSMSGSK